MTATEGSAELFVDLVDEIVRVRSRIDSLRRRQVPVPGGGSAHLAILAAVVSASSPPTMAQIARSFGQSRQAVQKVTAELLTHQIVAQVAGHGHPRVRGLVATAKGRALHAKVGSESRGWARRLVSDGDRDELGAAVATLRKIRHRLEQSEMLDRNLEHAEDLIRRRFAG